MEKSELIALYFTNKLSVEAKHEFDHLMQNDETFAQEVALQKDIKKAIRLEEKTETKNKLQAIEAREKTSSFNYKKWLAAASIVILLGVSGIWVLNSRPPNTEQLYADYFEPYRNVAHPILRGETDESLKTKAFKAYERGKYTEALNYFNQLLAIQEDKTMAFYKANILLQLNKTEEAIVIFNQSPNPSEDLISKRHWYLALAYLKQNKLDQAKQELQQLKALNDTFKAKEVEELLKILD